MDGFTINRVGRDKDRQRGGQRGRATRGGTYREEGEDGLVTLPVATGTASPCFIQNAYLRSKLRREVGVG